MDAPTARTCPTAEGAVPRPRIGAWLVGARGSVATTAQVGAAAIAAGLTPPTGMVTELDDFADLPLPAVADLVFGGHDVTSVPLRKRADQLADAGVMHPVLTAAVGDHLDEVDGRIRPGVAPVTLTDGIRPAVDRVAGDLADFRRDHDLDAVVVVNVASTEAPLTPDPAHATPAALTRALDDGRDVLPVSALYALAAIEAGCSYANFTPSTGIQLPALEALAAAAGIPYAGRDGKTGETLVKTALAPMFAQRNLRVRSWAGTNLLGGGDGATLADPDRARTKLAAKERCLPGILGYTPAMPLQIDHVPDMGEWKTAWDHIAFEGFLGTGMTMQFTWQGCDSTLAAPLVLDLIRLVGAAQLNGVAGPLDALGFFFKDPIASDEHRLDRQYQHLVAWAARL